jgi:tRNA threonylcarbamoyl adenosine modification protein YeaZ
MKYILAIESSSCTHSVALAQNGTLISEQSFESGRGASRDVILTVHEILENQNISPEDIAVFTVGLGPGNFTGLRTSLAAAEAMALPSRSDVIGISSAEICAFYTAQKLPETNSGANEQRVIVVGDARRQRLWMAAFSTATEDSIPKRLNDFQLIPIDELPQHCVQSDIIVTPDWKTLGSSLSSLCPNSILLPQAVLPTAADTARLAHLRITADIPGEPLQPIYMHPPVFVEPRFTESAKRRL